MANLLIFLYKWAVYCVTTNIDQSVLKQAEIRTLTLVLNLGKFPSTLGVHSRRNKIYTKRKAMLRQTRAQKNLGRVESGVHLLEKGVALGNSIYQIGRTLAPLAAML